MPQTIPTHEGRDVTVRPTPRRLLAQHDGSGYGYRVDYIDGAPRLTYCPDQLSADRLGKLVHDLATMPLVSP